MRFCQAHQLARTRRILADTQAEIETAARRRRRYKFEPWQLEVARRSDERQQSIKEAGKAA